MSYIQDLRKASAELLCYVRDTPLNLPAKDTLNAIASIKYLIDHTPSELVEYILSGQQIHLTLSNPETRQPYPINQTIAQHPPLGTFLLTYTLGAIVEKHVASTRSLPFDPKPFEQIVHSTMTSTIQSNEVAVYHRGLPEIGQKRQDSPALLDHTN